MFGFKKKEQEVTGDNKPKILKCECGNDMFRNVVKVQFKPTAFTDWDDWYFECTKCNILYNHHGEVVHNE